MKICPKCKIEKDESEFYKDRERLHSSCKECNRKHKRQFRKEFPEKVKKTEQKRNKLKRTAWRKEWYQKNKDKLKQIAKQYRDNIVPEELKRRRKIYEKNRRRSLYSKLKQGLRDRIGKALKHGYKSHHTMELLGCSIEFFRDYIESKFLPGMNWLNWGLGNDKWNLDHIIPCASFNLLLEEDQKKCFHYTNYQPLWQPDNLKKGRSLECHKLSPLKEAKGGTICTA